MRHRFGKGYRNVLYTHPLSREKRRLSISNSIAIRKSMGLPVGRASKLHNHNGTLTREGREVLNARKHGMKYRRIADIYDVGVATVWRHCHRCWCAVSRVCLAH